MQIPRENGLEAVILAGGKGTRLQSVVSDRPKVLAPVAGVPFLHILLAHLANKGFSRVVLSVGYMAGQVIQATGGNFAGLDICYVKEEEPLGTGGGLRLALQACLRDHVFVLNGDTFLDLDFAQVEVLWQKMKEPILIGRNVEDTARYGRLQTEGARVTAFMEKGVPGPGLINAGCYILPPSILDGFPPETPFSLEEKFLQPFVTKHPMLLFVTDGVFIDIGVPEDYARAQTMWQSV
ncbi:MAG: nucleotidyltransferase family protein [Desulfobulbus sp.]|jgi:D-glycero-alpha-D-manno-heptose 1-phosphate guanylyltransferase|uniref:nucleotidyltransferase family protein n=1 Tax=Desulfobulbus sp. TaxID=895 RepID=UPI00283F383F|nr:nucleotidyltransferase family protein [Desulfobulbus sp.]MDR2548592.1 nucleotidyltransferase family protein [Desulfobulbus sp.]